MIPKIIHQTWKNHNVPDEWKDAQQSWIKNHPDWKYKLWTDIDNLNFLKKYYPWFLNTYNSYPYNIQRADAIRPFLLYHYGGLYVDMDTFCLKKFDNVFIKKGVYILESAHIGVSNSLMASSKKHSFWKIVIEQLINNKDKKFYQTRHLYIMSSTGPSLINNCITIYRKNKSNNGLFILPKNLFNPCGVCIDKCKLNNKIYSYTINSSTWHQIDSKIFNIFYCYFKIVALIAIMIFLLTIITRRNKLSFF